MKFIIWSFGNFESAEMSRKRNYDPFKKKQNLLFNHHSSHTENDLCVCVRWYGFIARWPRNLELRKKTSYAPPHAHKHEIFIYLFLLLLPFQVKNVDGSVRTSSLHCEFQHMEKYSPLLCLCLCVCTFCLNMWDHSSIQKKLITKKKNMRVDLVW